MRLARTLLAGASVLTVVLGVTAVATGLAYIRQIEPTLPDNKAIVEWQPHEGTTILAADGSVLGVHATQQRRFVPLDQIPPLVANAFIAAEDGQYWTHHGINPVAIVRATLSNFRHGNRGRLAGASTITQQVVKNLLLSSERTIDRKFREALLAIRVDREIGKKRILEIYLNEIYLGENYYGIAAAAKGYFGKELADLSPNEAAVLATLPKTPSLVNPVKNMARTMERRDYVIGRMLEDGYIDQAAYDAAKGSPIRLADATKKAQDVDFADRSPEEAVRRSLVADMGADRMYRDGGEVRTTIVPSLQKTVHRELRAGLVREDRRSGWKGPLASGIALPVDWNDPALAPPSGAEDWAVGVVRDVGKDAVLTTPDGDVTVTGQSLAWATAKQKASALLRVGDAVLIADLGHGPEVVSLPDVQGAVVVLDPATGGIRALDGGFSTEESEFNRAIQARRQTGSVFKAFDYLTALELGYDATSPILDVPIALDQGAGLADWRPTSHNAGMGLITLRRSLELSRNESTVRLVYDVGLDRVADTARRAGLKLPATLTYSMALGTAEVSPLNVAEAYAALANGGHHVDTTFLAASTPPALTKQDFDPIAVAQLSSILEGVTYAGTAKSAFDGFDKPIASKTGTTDQSKDAWFVSYGPKFVMAIWVGRDDSKPLARGAEGGATAGRIGRAIFDAAGSDLDFEPFTLPDGTDTLLVDRATGLADDKGDVVEIVRTEEKKNEQ